MAPLPWPVRTRPLLSKTGLLYLLTCLFLHDSVWVTISSSSQGEQWRNRHQLCVIERGRRRHGYHPFDTLQANFRAECLFSYITVRRISLAVIIKIILDSLFPCIQLLFIKQLSSFLPTMILSGF